jgi:hypothetical protein
MHSPLQAISDWWEPLDKFHRPFIAMEVCYRLTTAKNIKHDYEVLFRRFLKGSGLTAERHVGRALGIRAVIDFHFVRHDPQKSLEWHLDTVEGEDPDLKRLANEAIGRIKQQAAATERTISSWKTLRKNELSDSSLIDWERLCRIASAHRKTG